jgi:hypothetical protein
MRRITFLAILTIALSVPTSAGTSRYDESRFSIQPFLHRLMKVLDIDRIVLPPG